MDVEASTTAIIIQLPTDKKFDFFISTAEELKECFRIGFFDGSEKLTKWLHKTTNLPQQTWKIRCSTLHSLQEIRERKNQTVIEDLKTTQGNNNPLLLGWTARNLKEIACEVNSETLNNVEKI